MNWMNRQWWKELVKPRDLQQSRDQWTWKEHPQDPPHVLQNIAHCFELLDMEKQLGVVSILNVNGTAILTRS